MSWMDFDDVRKQGGMRAKDFPIYKSGDQVAIDVKVQARKHAAQLKAEKERAQKQAEARRRKAEQDQLKAEAKAQKKAAKKAKKAGN